MGKRRANIREALRLLPRERIALRRISSLYRTEPVEYREQRWFVNCVVEAATKLAPVPLLRSLKRIEKQLGRAPGIPKGPRPIDIDILFYENRVVRQRALRIPHPRFADRRFVLIPLAEIAPALCDPVSGLTLSRLMRRTSDRSRVTKMANHPLRIESQRKAAVGKPSAANRPSATERKA